MYVNFQGVARMYFTKHSLLLFKIAAFSALLSHSFRWTLVSDTSL